MCSGKTHLICSAALVATPVIVMKGSLTTPLANPGQALGGAGLILIGVVGGLFPDLDAPSSELLHAPNKLARKAGRITMSALGLPKPSILGLMAYALFWLPGAFFTNLLAGLSVVIRGVSHHRGLTHELRGLLIFTGFVLLLTASLATIWQLPPPTILSATLSVGAAWTLGYSSHLILDAATIAGIPLLSAQRIFHLLPRGQRIRTGTWPDTLLLRGVAGAWLVLILVLTFWS